MKLKNYSKLNLIPDNKKYLIAFSGGPDSTFLFFHCLQILNKENLFVAHVNYNLREGSINAQQLVEDYCNKNQIPLFIKNITKNNASNLESWARKERYKFFKEVCLQEKLDAVLVAHTFDDDIETYALQKQRGNIVSHYGLNYDTVIFETKILRPMLLISKNEVLNFLEENNLSFNIDVTNSDTKYLRNKIRKEMTSEMSKNLLMEKNSKNRMIKIAYKKVLPLINKDFFIKDYLTLNDKEELVFIYEYLRKYIPSWDVSKIKKNITSEIAKQIRSQKSFVRIIVNNDYSLIKDREKCFILENIFINFNEKIISLEELKKCSFFANYNEVEELFYKLGSIFVTNDFMKYQSKLEFKGLKLNKLFTKNKTTYYWKFKNLIILAEEESNNILNKLI